MSAVDAKTEALEDQPLSVSDFIAEVNASLLSHRGKVEGEVTSINKTYPKAIYLSLKDLSSDALLNCVVWRGIYDKNGVDIKEGDKIIVTGVPEIWAPRGSFSLKVQTIEYAGEGALKKSYDELKKKLAAEGLLEIDRKRPLPDYPKRIGVITSRSGVVIQDFNSNLGRYGFQTIMVDSRVEGKDAIHEILAALKTMSKQDIEVLVIMRGGGSWESLQAFNTESVVRAISEFKCPVLTGIGHDVDVTLSELVADVGASTPTAVAEALNETWDTLAGSISTAESKIVNSYQRRLATVTQLFDASSNTLFRKYDQRLGRIRSDLNEIISSVHTHYRAIEKTITQANTDFQRVVAVLRAEIKSAHSRVNNFQVALLTRFGLAVNALRQSLNAITRHLRVQQGGAVRSVKQLLVGLEQNIKLSDPSRNLKLGYSLSYVSGKLVRSTKDLSVGDLTETKLADGSFTSEIKDVI